MIEDEGYTQFYSGGRGSFDKLCAEVVGELKKTYPQIKNTLVFSYLPSTKEDFTFPAYYDDSVYLLTESVPPRYAILRTNKKLVEKADCLVVGIVCEWGGAWQAVKYAQRKKKQILNICEPIEK